MGGRGWRRGVAPGGEFWERGGGWGGGGRGGGLQGGGGGGGKGGGGVFCLGGRRRGAGSGWGGGGAGGRGGGGGGGRGRRCSAWRGRWRGTWGRKRGGMIRLFWCWREFEGRRRSEVRGRGSESGGGPIGDGEG